MALQALSNCREQLCRETLPAALFAQQPVVRFRPEQEVCDCGHRLSVQKTREKTVRSMALTFRAYETVLECPECARVFYCETLRRLVARGCNMAWDIVVFVGRSLFQHHRTDEQVRCDLLTRDVRLCLSEVNYLGRKFITYLALAHALATPRINEAIKRKGGYILHLDATHQGQAPALMTGIDSLSRFVLANVKIPSEHAENIMPFLEKLKSDYDVPIACVHDMGTGICKAVTEVFPGVGDFICHFHFLRDIGKDLLGPSYGKLRSCLRKKAATTEFNAIMRQAGRRLHARKPDARQLANAIAADDNSLPDTQLLPLACTYSFALWCLHGKHNGDGYGFPFDRPLMEFAGRLLTLLDRLPDLLMRVPAKGRLGNQLFLKFTRKVIDIVQEPEFEEVFEDLKWRCKLFDDLRKKMRIAMPDGKNGLNDEGTSRVMSSIRLGVEQFRRRLDQNKKFADDILCCKVAKQIDKYNEKLFADPIELNTPTGSVIIYPQRTNNILEQFFRDMHRKYRRKTGNNSMGRSLQTMLADTPLLKNLENSEYVKILLGDKKNLEELFADLEMNSFTNPIESKTDTDRILPGFRKLMQMPALPDQVARLINGRVSSGQSN